jgi:beta-RFAP synthase
MPSRPDESLHPQTLALTAPARLHLGFLDMGAHLGRRFGSLGVSLDRPSLQIEGRLAATRTITGPQSGRVDRLLDLLAQQFGLTRPVELRVVQAIPDHAGLGSGTQLALAVGTLVAHLHGRPMAAGALARALDRGNRSGIGIGAFERGGFLVDGGRGAEDSPPPILARLDFPAAWRILLLFDPARQGLHGHAERDAFRDLPEFPQAAAARLCHLTLLQALPALTESRLESFGLAITEIQATVGDHFAAAQGGRFSSPLVAQALDRLGAVGASCRGQSSWGPTGFVVAADASIALEWADRLRDLQPAGLHVEITEACAQGMRWHAPGVRSQAYSTGMAQIRN